MSISTPLCSSQYARCEWPKTIQCTSWKLRLARSRVDPDTPSPCTTPMRHPCASITRVRGRCLLSSAGSMLPYTASTGATADSSSNTCGWVISPAWITRSTPISPVKTAAGMALARVGIWVSDKTPIRRETTPLYLPAPARPKRREPGLLPRCTPSRCARCGGPG